MSLKSKTMHNLSRVISLPSLGVLCWCPAMSVDLLGQSTWTHWRAVVAATRAGDVFSMGLYSHTAQSHLNYPIE